MMLSLVNVVPPSCEIVGNFDFVVEGIETLRFLITVYFAINPGDNYRNVMNSLFSGID